MDRTAAAVVRPRRAWLPWAIGILWILALGLTIGAPALFGMESAALYRSWRFLPGIVDVCGTPTLFARSIPPALALAGVGLTFLLEGRRTVVLPTRAVGVALAIALLYATMQNVAWGQRLCIVD